MCHQDQYPEYFKNDLAMEREVATMAMPILKKKWKLLNEPHSDFDGTKVSAIQVGDNPRLAKIASRGSLLVDTRACSSVCRPEAFRTPTLDSEAQRNSTQ